MNIRKAPRRLLMAIPWAVLAAALNPACASKDGAAPPDQNGGNAGPGGSSQSGGSDSGDQPDAASSTRALLEPPDFQANGKTAVFVDISAANAILTIDVGAKKATVKAHMDIRIRQAAGGAPLFDLVPPAARSVTVDGTRKLPLATVTSPDGLSVMRMVDGVLSSGSHSLDFDEYVLQEGKAKDGTALEGITFAGGGAEFLSNEDDTQRRGFFERYFSAGFERDRYPFTVTVKVENAPAGQQPDVMTNGAKETSADGKSFQITFPQRDNTSSWFMHVIDRAKYGFATGEYKSVDGRAIPLTAYDKVQSNANLCISDMKVFLQELEGDYGPFPHDSLLASLNGVNDAEEYDGAVQTDFDPRKKTPIARGSLGHEMLHQWFGRSARPLNGRSGWVDEAIAEWRDDGYPRASNIELNGDYEPLAVSSPYQRHTPEVSYDQGSDMLQGIDYLLRDRGGLKPVLAAFHAQYRDKLYTSENFLNSLKESAPDLSDQMDQLFAEKVYAGATPSRNPGPYESP